MQIFQTIFYEPMYNLMVLFYNLTGDVGVAIVVVTLVLKLILLPFSVKMLKAQKSLQSLQPKLQELQKKYKDNREALAKATMELYKKEKINPFSSCLPLLIQLPFLFAIFRVFSDGFNGESLNLVYSFISRPDSINPITLGLINLADPQITIALLAGAAQFWQTRMLTHSKQPQVDGSKDESMASAMNKQMMYIMPVVTIGIGATLPGGLTLYWLLFTLLTVLQQHFLFKQKDDGYTQPQAIN